jgi:hypothetical protein
MASLAQQEHELPSCLEIPALTCTGPTAQPAWGQNTGPDVESLGTVCEGETSIAITERRIQRLLQEL